MRINTRNASRTLTLNACHISEDSDATQSGFFINDFPKIRPPYRNRLSMIADDIWDVLFISPGDLPPTARSIYRQAAPVDSMARESAPPKLFSTLTRRISRTAIRQPWWRQPCRGKYDS